jgi:hypothetical protein
VRASRPRTWRLFEFHASAATQSLQTDQPQRFHNLSHSFGHLRLRSWQAGEGSQVPQRLRSRPVLTDPGQRHAHWHAGLDRRYERIPTVPNNRGKGEALVFDQIGELEKSRRSRLPSPTWPCIRRSPGKDGFSVLGCLARSRAGARWLRVETDGASTSGPSGARPGVLLPGSSARLARLRRPAARPSLRLIAVS